MPEPRAAVDEGSNLVRVSAPFSYKDALKAIPGARWDGRNKQWTVPATPVALSTLTRVVDVDGAGDNGNRALIEAQQYADMDRGDARDLPQPGGLATAMWAHQRAAYHFARSLLTAPGASGGAMLAMWMGTGKTLVAIALDQALDTDWTLILCPKAVMPVWAKDYAKHVQSDGATPPKRVIHVDPSTSWTVKKRVEYFTSQIQDAKRLGQGVVLVVNYESAWRDPMNTLLTRDIRRWDLVILDESSKIKAPGGKASQWCAKIRDRARARLALNGTPFPHSPLDIYAQYRFLDPGVFGLSYSQFKARYAVMGGFGNQQVVDYQNLGDLGERYRMIAYQAGPEVLDLPEQLDVTWTAHLGGKAAKAYAELEADFYTQVEGGEVTVANALTKLLRLQQITGGTLPVEEGPDERIDEAKAELLRELFNELEDDEPVVVFARFRADLERVREIADAEGRVYSELSGAVNDLSAWQDGFGTVLGVQISSGSLGIDLTRARYGVYYSLGFSLGDYLQSRSRLHRPGQARTTTFYHLIASGTVDEKIQAALAKRQDVVEAIVNGEVE